MRTPILLIVTAIVGLGLSGAAGLDNATAPAPAVETGNVVEGGVTYEYGISAVPVH